MPSALIQHQQNYSPMASPSAFNNSETDPHKDPWYPFSNGAHFNSNIAMILIFIFCALICALAINAVVRFFLRISDQQEEESNRKPAPEVSSTTLQSLPTLVFSSGTKLHLAGAGADGGTAECAICLSEFVDGDSVRILPKCKHGFHVKCIQGWLSSHVSCPTCRTHYDVESPPPPPVLPSLPPAAAASTPSLQLQPLQIAGAGEHHQSPAAVASVPPLQVQVSE